MRVETEFPTWAVFACQVFVDTRREWGDQTSASFENLQNTFSWLQKSWSTCLNDDGTVALANIKDGLQEKLQYAIKLHKALAEADCVDAMISYVLQDYQEIRASLDFGPHFLLRNHPLLCGLWVQHGLKFMHTIGIMIADSLGPLKSAIHLSNAVYLAGVQGSGGAWSDLEFIVKKHGATHLFVGDRPNKLNDCGKHMALAFGSGPSFMMQIKNDKWNSRNPQRNIGNDLTTHRHILPMSRYANAADNRLATRFGTNIERSRAGDDPFVMMEILVGRLINSKDVSCPANPSNEKQRTKTHFLAPLQTLKIYKQALKEDELPLRFDLISLHWRCYELLRKIQDTCVQLSPKGYAGLGADNCIVTTILYMLADVVGDLRQQASPFGEACRLVRDVVAIEGGSEYLAAQARTAIAKGPARVGEDVENFEDPDVNFIPGLLRSSCIVDKETIDVLKSRRG